MLPEKNEGGGGVNCLVSAIKDYIVEHAMLSLEPVFFSTDRMLWMNVH